jgi:cell pole-organizing protein PopZ
MTLENIKPVGILDEAAAVAAKSTKKKAPAKPKATAPKAPKADAKAPAKTKGKTKVETPVEAKAPEAVEPKKAALTVVEGSGKGPGRPISEAQVKVRRRVQAFIEKQTGQFTVKQVAKALKMSRMHVSNALRWCDHQKMVKKAGYKDNEGRAGRKELLFVSLVKVKKAEDKKAA